MGNAYICDWQISAHHSRSRRTVWSAVFLKSLTGRTLGIRNPPPPPQGHTHGSGCLTGPPWPAPLLSAHAETPKESRAVMGGPSQIQNLGCHTRCQTTAPTSSRPEHQRIVTLGPRAKRAATIEKEYPQTIRKGDGPKFPPASRCKGTLRCPPGIAHRRLNRELKLYRRTVANRRAEAV